MFSSLWPYVVILCFLSKTSTPLPASKLSAGGAAGGGGEERQGGFLLLSSTPELPQRACVQATYSLVLCTISGKFSVWSFFIVE